MRNDFHRFSAIAERALAFNHGKIHAPRCHVIYFDDVFVQEALIVSNILIRFISVFCHEDFSMFHWIHGSGINIDIRINFYRSYFESARFQNRAQRCGRDSLADSRHNSTGNKDICSTTIHNPSIIPHLKSSRKKLIFPYF